VLELELLDKETTVELEPQEVVLVVTFAQQVVVELGLSAQMP
jgi:hypothetical protein